MKELFICVRVADDAVPLGVGGYCPKCEIGIVMRVDRRKVDPVYTCSICEDVAVPALTVEVNPVITYLVSPSVNAERKKTPNPSGSEADETVPV